MTRSRKRSPARRRRKTRRRLPLLRLGLGALALGLLALLVYVWHLDREVRQRFEGKRWALPARVYARPLEVYPGAPLGPQDLVRELRLLRYRPGSSTPEPGTYHVGDGRVRLHTRPFEFWDGPEPGRALAVSFHGERVGEVRDTGTGRPEALVRLEPAAIASIYPAHGEDRTLVRLAEVPPLLVQALMAVEDRSFRTHRGVDLKAVARAAVANLRAREVVQGGSTLTQQLVKNFYLTSERTLRRKANEALMALLLEWRYSKDEILEAYCNEVYLGQDGRRSIHGFGLASRFYFERPLEELSPPQVALLVALVRGPSLYDPRRNPERARARRDLVLDLLARQGLVASADARRAQAAPLGVAPQPPSGVTRYPAFLDLVRRQLARDYREEDLRSEGLRIFTTLDPGVQEAAEQALGRGLRDLGGAELQGAAVVAGPGTGEVLAAVGGRDPGLAGFNRALDAVRPIGSLVKPAVYLAALSRPDRYTLATLVDDSPLEVELPSGPWSPRNFDRTFHGLVPLYQALVHSYNVATVRLGLDVGLDPVRDALRALGVEREVRPYPSLLLGAVSLTPLEVAQMYQTLAGGGFRSPLRAIREVLTADGEPLQRYPLTVERAADARVVHLVDEALRRVLEEGTGRTARGLLPRGLAAAGKTGSTDDLRDSWFAGYTGDRVAVVWVGRDDNAPMGLTGAAGALRIWADLLLRAGAASLGPARPEGVETAWVDPETGESLGPGCRRCVELPFLTGSAPEPPPPSPGFGGPVDWLRRLFR
ncbi:MAG: penicillin-binding protein 1B [Deferrisomatales bacterium]